MRSASFVASAHPLDNVPRNVMAGAKAAFLAGPRSCQAWKLDGPSLRSPRKSCSACLAKSIVSIMEKNPHHGVRRNRTGRDSLDHLVGAMMASRQGQTLVEFDS